MSNEACCAHLRVEYKPTPAPQGSFERWECLTCGEEFKPVTPTIGDILRAAPPSPEPEGEPEHTTDRIKELRRSHGHSGLSDPDGVNAHPHYCTECGQEADDVEDNEECGEVYFPRPDRFPSPCLGTYCVPSPPSPTEDNDE